MEFWTTGEYVLATGCILVIAFAASKLFLNFFKKAGEQQKENVCSIHCLVKAIVIVQDEYFRCVKNEAIEYSVEVDNELEQMFKDAYALVEFNQQSRWNAKAIDEKMDVFHEKLNGIEIMVWGEILTMIEIPNHPIVLFPLKM